jgi:hypothetical protein
MVRRSGRLLNIVANHVQRPLGRREPQGILIVGISWSVRKMLISLTLLALESSSVIALRAIKLTVGDSDAMEEAGLMVSEKVAAAFEATANLMAGATGVQIVDRYREHVALNAQRLAKR